MTLPRAAFERGVRRLDGPGARGFVADLLEARGYRTAVAGRVVTATDGSGESTRILVLAGAGAAAAAVRGARVDAVLVTGGPLAGIAGRGAVRAGARESGEPPALLDAGTLYEWFAYAVDAEARSTLADRYLDATEPTALGRAWAGVVAAATGAGGRVGRLSAPSRPAVAAVLVALVVLATAATAGPFGQLASVGAPATADGRAPTPSITPAPATATPGPATAAPGDGLPDVCPPPPLGEHPATLRPAVLRTATASGLDGWRVLVTQNISEYDFDPNDQQAGTAPEMRHVAVFETPGGTPLRLVLDRWSSVDRAEAAVERGGAWGLGLQWNAYTVGVEWDPGEPSGETSARELLAAVTNPDGTRLGLACVSALATGPATNTTTA